MVCILSGIFFKEIPREIARKNLNDRIKERMGHSLALNEVFWIVFHPLKLLLIRNLFYLKSILPMSIIEEANEGDNGINQYQTKM
jgi:hypothetical protein